MGSGTVIIRKAVAVLQMPKQFCVVAKKIPPVTEILRFIFVRLGAGTQVLRLVSVSINRRCKNEAGV